RWRRTHLAFRSHYAPLANPAHQLLELRLAEFPRPQDLFAAPQRGDRHHGQPVMFRLEADNLQATQRQVISQLRRNAGGRVLNLNMLASFGPDLEKDVVKAGHVDSWEG